MLDTPLGASSLGTPLPFDDIVTIGTLPMAPFGSVLPPPPASSSYALSPLPLPALSSPPAITPSLSPSPASAVSLIDIACFARLARAVMWAWALDLDGAADFEFAVSVRVYDALAALASVKEVFRTASLLLARSASSHLTRYRCDLCACCVVCVLCCVCVRV